MKTSGPRVFLSKRTLLNANTIYLRDVKLFRFLFCFPWMIIASLYLLRTLSISSSKLGNLNCLKLFWIFLYYAFKSVELVVTFTIASYIHLLFFSPIVSLLEIYQLYLPNEPISTFIDFLFVLFFHFIKFCSDYFLSSALLC